MGRSKVINGVNVPEDQNAACCGRHGVDRLPLFGGILREATPEGGYGFCPSSDMDMLVEFLAGRTPGRLVLSGIQIELFALIGREVVPETRGLPPHIARDTASD